MIDDHFLEKIRNDRELQLTISNLVRVAAVVRDLERRIETLEKGISDDNEKRTTPRSSAVAG